MISNHFLVFPALEDRIRRSLGLAPLSAAAATLAAVTGVGVRLALALLATALVGEWAGIPWGRWAVVLAFYASFDATQPRRTPPLDVPRGPGMTRWMEDWMALLPTLARESDLQDLAHLTRRWYRLPVSATAGVTTATIMLLACRLFAPTALGELPAGSIILLALVLFDFGASCINPLDWAFMTREARCDHHLFWPSPADSPEVRAAMGTGTFLGYATGMWITIYLVLTVVLVSWESPLVQPLAVGFIMIGYVYTICTALGWRASIQKIVERARDQRLDQLRYRIGTFEPRVANLSPEEAEHVRVLIDLHRMIRDAPTTPAATHTLMHSVGGLIIPTITFMVAVFGEVYAERILDALLP